MANSKYEYVKLFETPDNLLPDTWIVVRLDGRAFHKFTTVHGFTKPNDLRALQLMNECALSLMREISDIVLAYGVSDEYSFILHPSCPLFERRASKLLTTFVSTFTSHYVYLWHNFFPSTPLQLPLPTFDGRVILYPREEHVKDYLRWRQADCHINNLYNTTFHALMQRGGLSGTEAELRLKGTVSREKHEIMWGFGINYNNEEEIFKKGSVIYRDLGRVSLLLSGVAEGREEDESEGGEVEEGDQGYQEEGEIEQREEEDKKAKTEEEWAEKHELGEHGAPSKARIVKEQAHAVYGHVAERVITTTKRKSKMEKNEEKKRKRNARLLVEHVDLIRESFWKERPWLLELRRS